MAAARTASPASLDALLAARRVWRGQPAALPPARQSTGFTALDDALPTRGWPDAALSELLLPADGIGELHLLLPTLARLTQAGRGIVLVAPPYLPYPAGWQQAGVDFAHVHLVDANPRDALWAAEQCLRAGCMAAVLCWPRQADDRALRRLQVACESGQALGFALRDAREARNPSPAALRVVFERGDAGVQLRVLKCRGGNAPTRAIALDAALAGRNDSLPGEAIGSLDSVPRDGRDATTDPMAVAGPAELPAPGDVVVRFVPQPAGAAASLRAPRQPDCPVAPWPTAKKDASFPSQRAETPVPWAQAGERMRNVPPAACIEEACA